MGGKMETATSKESIKNALLAYWQTWVPQYTTAAMLTAYGKDQTDDDDKTNKKLSDIGFSDIKARACWHEYCVLVTQAGGPPGAVDPDEAQDWASSKSMKGIVLTLCKLANPTTTKSKVRKPR
jgi:hypothetical protein